MATLFKRQWPRWAVCWLLLCQIQALSIIDRVLYGHWLANPAINSLNSNISQIIISIILFVVGSRRWPTSVEALFSRYLWQFFYCALWLGRLTPEPPSNRDFYFFFILGVIGAAENLEGDDFMDLLASVCFLSAVVSLSLIFISPSYADWRRTGDFAAFLATKTSSDKPWPLARLACLHRLRARKRSRLSGVFMLLVFTFVALKSRSTTSALVILLFCVIGAVIQLLQKGGAGRNLGVVLLTLLLLVAPVAAISSGFLAGIDG